MDEIRNEAESALAAVSELRNGWERLSYSSQEAALRFEELRVSLHRIISMSETVTSQIQDYRRALNTSNTVACAAIRQFEACAGTLKSSSK